MKKIKEKTKQIIINQYQKFLFDENDNDIMPVVIKCCCDC